VGPRGFFRSSSDSMVGGQRESLRRLGTSHAHIGFEVVGTSSEESPKKIKDSEPGTREAEVEIDLDNELRSLLDSLNA